MSKKRKNKYSSHVTMHYSLERTVTGTIEPAMRFATLRQAQDAMESMLIKDYFQKLQTSYTITQVRDTRELLKMVTKENKPT